MNPKPSVRGRRATEDGGNAKPLRTDSQHECMTETHWVLLYSSCIRRGCHLLLVTAQAACLSWSAWRSATQCQGDPPLWVPAAGPGQQLQDPQEQPRSWENLKPGKTGDFTTFLPYTVFQKGVYQIAPPNFPITSLMVTFPHLSQGSLTLRFIFRALLLWQQGACHHSCVLAGRWLCALPGYYSESSFIAFL